MDIHNDEPAQQDLLGREAYVNALTEVATSCETPVVIGIYGRWGVGKTTLLRLIHDRIAQHGKAKVVWFDAWQHQFDDHPALALVHTISDQLGIKDSVKKILYALARGISGWALKATTSLAITDVDQSLKAYEQQNFLVREASVRLREHFKEVISKAQEGSRVESQRIVIFIDDLDRCLSESILNVLEALKLYLNVSGCVYFLGVDRKALETSIRYHYKDAPLDELSYLDKIVQLPFIIPPMEPEYARSYIRSCIPVDFKSFSESQMDACVELLYKGLERTPRTIKRFVNTLMLNFALAKETMENPRMDVLVALLLVQYINLKLYERLSIQPHLVNALTGDTDDQALEEEFKADVQKIRRIISDVPLPDINEILKYIYLTRLAYIFDDDKYFRYDSKGFYTEKGLEKYLIDEKVIGDEERIIQSLLLFETPQQHTWLVTTKKHLICLLDEEWTQKYRTVIQWKMDIHSFPLDEIKAYKTKNGMNVVELGRQAPYLYSEKLYSKPKELEEAIHRLVTNTID